jgi:hypothetical protein
VFKNYGFSLKAKNKLLLETKGSESAGVALRTRGESEVFLLVGSTLYARAHYLFLVSYYFISKLTI